MTTATLEKQSSPTAFAHSPAGDLGGKYLTFRLASEEFGLAILKVREINGVMSITAVPQMPHYMKGVINLRGKVVPVIDLRLRFGLKEAEHTEQTCIILVDVGYELGIIVDTVSEVLEVPGDQIDPPPQLGGTVDTSFILGMGKVGDAVKILLDIDKILTVEDLNAVSTVLDLHDGPTAPGRKGTGG
jgi:purine-binding chemotaxis protein CheW